MRTFSLSSFVLCGALVLGCGGGTRIADDAGPGNDAFTPGVDAFTPGVDAFTPLPDAATPMNDAFVPPGDDAGAGAGACSNTTDEAISMGATFSTDLGNCAMTGFGAEPGLMTCITGLGLSAGCAACFDQQVHCTIMHCALQCAGGDSAMCTTCRATHCDAAFTTCSGFAP